MIRFTKSGDSSIHYLNALSLHQFHQWHLLFNCHHWQLHPAGQEMGHYQQDQPLKDDEGGNKDCGSSSL